MTIADRCTNWGHAVRVRAIRGRCMSFESNWRSPQCWEAPQPRRLVDVRDAMEIEHAWASLQTAFHATILAGWYVWGLRPENTLRKALKASQGHSRGRLPEWEGSLAMSHLFLEDQLVLPAVVRRIEMVRRVRAAFGLHTECISEPIAVCS